MAYGSAHCPAVFKNDEAIHVVMLYLHPRALVAHISGMIGGGIKTPGNYHITRSGVQSRILHLYQLGPQRIQLQEYPIQMSGILAADCDLHIAGIVLLLAYLEALDLELTTHVHDLIQDPGQHLGVDEMALHLNICNLCHKLALHHVSPSRSAWVLSFVLMMVLVILIR